MIRGSGAAVYTQRAMLPQQAQEGQWVTEEEAASLMEQVQHRICSTAPLCVRVRLGRPPLPVGAAWGNARLRHLR